MLDRRLLSRASPASAGLALSTGLGFLAGGLAVAQAWLLSAIVARAFLGRAPLTELSSLLGLLLAAGLGRALAAGLSEIAAGQAAVEIKQQLRTALLDHILRLGPAHAQGERTGEISATLAEGVEALEAYFSQYLPQLALAALVPVTILAVVLPLDPLSGVVLALTAPLIPFFMILIGRAVETLTRRQFDLLRGLSARFLDALQGLTTLKLLGQSRAQVGVVARASEAYARATLDVLRVAFLSALVLEMVGTLSTAIVAVQIGLRLLQADLGFQPALFILILAPEFYLPLRQLGQRFHASALGVSAAQRIFALLDTPLPPAAGVRPTGAPPPGHRPAVALQAVHYTYPDGRPALRGVDLQVQAGQQVALVGPSGAGKSTVAHLLLRFAAPESGVILVNGQPLAEWPADVWRARIAWVPQRPHLFHDSVRANLQLARPGASAAEIEQAAQQAHLHDFILSLPRGYDTLIGERGERLSGGQAQRLALARAFLRDAPLLILDEPTAHLDPELELQLQSAMRRLVRGRTALIIAHRLQTVQRADHIFVLAEGRVAEHGTHAELAARGGLYQRLIAAGRDAGGPLP